MQIILILNRRTCGPCRSARLAKGFVLKRWRPARTTHKMKSNAVTIDTTVKLQDEAMAAEIGRDVRMRGFQTRVEVGQVITWIDARVAALEAESISLPEAGGRVLARDVSADCAVPGFDRAAMDGYALRG